MIASLPEHGRTWILEKAFRWQVMVGRAIVVLDHEGLPHEFAEVMEIVGQMEYGKEKLTPTCRRRQTKSPTSKAAASASALSDPL
jgi:hypothetical protein